MQVVLCITCWVYFKHWECQMEKLIQDKYILMLQSKSAANKITFKARMMSLAKQIAKNCHDQIYPDKLLTDCQKVLDTVYEEG